MNRVDFQHEAGRAVKHVMNLPRVVEREYGAELEEEVFAPEKRDPVTDTTRVPYRFICRLELIWVDQHGHNAGEQSDGTGILVSSRHVLTAAHCVKRKSKKTGQVLTAGTVVVIPGKNTAAPALKWHPFGRYVVKKAPAIHPNWLTTFDGMYDIALLTLEQNVGDLSFKTIGNQTLGYWGSKKHGGGTVIKAVPPADLINKDVLVAGYPANKCGTKPMGGICLPPGRGGGTLYVGSDKAIAAEPVAAPLQLRYMADASSGQSGGPVWLPDPATNELRLVAIHHGTPDGVSNSGVLITSGVITQLRQWGCGVCGA